MCNACGKVSVRVEGVLAWSSRAGHIHLGKFPIHTFIISITASTEYHMQSWYTQSVYIPSQPCSIDMWMSMNRVAKSAHHKLHYLANNANYTRTRIQPTPRTRNVKQHAPKRQTLSPPPREIAARELMETYHTRGRDADPHQAIAPDPRAIEIVRNVREQDERSVGLARLLCVVSCPRCVDAANENRWQNADNGRAKDRKDLHD